MLGITLNEAIRQIQNMEYSILSSISQYYRKQKEVGILGQKRIQRANYQM